MNLNEIRARCMCYGVHVGPDLVGQLEHADGLDTGFIHGTVLLIDGQHPVNTSLLDPSYSNHTEAMDLRYDGGRFVLRHGAECVLVDFLPTAPFHSLPLGNATHGDYLQLHNAVTLFSTPVRQCAYIAAGKPCLFCTYEDGAVRRQPVDEFSRLLDRYLTWRPMISSIAFGGGSPNVGDYGAQYYAELAAVAKQAGLAVSVELVPSKKDEDWQSFLESGYVDSVVSSLEIWDDDERRRILLGKSELSRAFYFARWRSVIETLGPSRVSSVLLVGLEPIESTRTGALELIDAGVIPTLIPYRPYEATRLGPREPVDYRSYLELSGEVADALLKAGLNPADQPGCVACGACSLERSMTDPKTARVEIATRRR